MAVTTDYVICGTDAIRPLWYRDTVAKAEPRTASSAADHDKACLSFLCAAASCGCDLACGHEVADIFLEELVVAVKLVMLLLDGLDPMEDHEEGVLQHLCMSVTHLLESFAEFVVINIFAAARTRLYALSHFGACLLP